jgi:competence protein ComGC
MEKTEAISSQADQLNEQASVFKKKSTDLRRQMKWKNMKMTIIIVLLITGILLVILIPLIKKAKKSEE